MKLQFSRVEYALVSGLKFGLANFKPYVRHELPPNSIFERLFGANKQTKLKDIHYTYTKKTFMVNGKQVRAMYEDLVKLSKFLNSSFALGFEARKKKILIWL